MILIVGGLGLVVNLLGLLLFAQHGHSHGGGAGGHGHSHSAPAGYNVKAPQNVRYEDFLATHHVQHRLVRLQKHCAYQGACE